MQNLEFFNYRFISTKHKKTMLSCNRCQNISRHSSIASTDDNLDGNKIYGQRTEPWKPAGTLKSRYSYFRQVIILSRRVAGDKQATCKSRLRMQTGEGIGDENKTRHWPREDCRGRIIDPISPSKSQIEIQKNRNQSTKFLFLSYLRKFVQFKRSFGRFKPDRVFFYY